MDNFERDKDWLLREKYGGKVTAAARRDIARLRRGEPVDYVIGFANFLGLKIDLSARPLIPRPETEYWAEKAIAGMPDKPLRVLDLFCGSGCIGLAVLARRPRARVDFADINRAYFLGIRRSARWNKIPARHFKLLRSNVLQNARMKYDYILANPPYIPTVGRAVQASVRKYEPPAALFAGRDGLKFIRPLLKQARGRLKPGGTLVLEFDPPQKKPIGALGRRWGYGVRFLKDQYGRSRYASLKI